MLFHTELCINQLHVCLSPPSKILHIDKNLKNAYNFPLHDYMYLITPNSELKMC